MEAIVCREGNTVQRWRDEGVGKAGLVAIKVPIIVSVRGRRGRGGLGFRGSNGIDWLFTCGLVLLFAEPVRFVDLCVDGRGRGLGPGGGEAAVWNQAFDRYDHGKSPDLTGDGASGHFVAEIGQ